MKKITKHPHMQFPSAYLWFILLSSIDIMMTWLILALGGQELNVLAQAVIQHFGLVGMILFKFALVLFVIIMCEIIGRKEHPTAKKLILISIIITCIPIVTQFKILTALSYQRNTATPTHTIQMI